jgi:hypothetical protein
MTTKLATLNRAESSKRSKQIKESSHGNLAGLRSKTSALCSLLSVTVANRDI